MIGFHFPCAGYSPLFTIRMPAEHDDAADSDDEDFAQGGGSGDGTALVKL